MLDYKNFSWVFKAKYWQVESGEFHWHNPQTNKVEVFHPETGRFSPEDAGSANIKLDGVALSSALSDHLLKIDEFFDNRAAEIRAPFSDKRYRSREDYSLDVAARAGKDRAALKSELDASLKAMSSASESGDREALARLSEEFERKHEQYKEDDSTRSLSFIYMYLSDEAEDRTNPPDAEAQKKEYRDHVAKLVHTSFKAQYQQFSKMLSEVAQDKGISREIVVAPNISGDDVAISLESPSFTITLPTEDENAMSPNMTLFRNEDGSYEVEDVIEAGDKDFFADDGVENDYFDIVEGLRGYGKEKAEGHVTLHRGMSQEEYDAWMRGDTIPKGKFFTSSRTAELAQDISGKPPVLFSFRVPRNMVRETDKGTFQLRTSAKLHEGGRKLISAD